MSKPRIKFRGGAGRHSQYVCVGAAQFNEYDTVGFGDSFRTAYLDWVRNAYPATPIRRRTKSG